MCIFYKLRITNYELLFVSCAEGTSGLSLKLVFSLNDYQSFYPLRGSCLEAKKRSKENSSLTLRGLQKMWPRSLVSQTRPIGLKQGLPLRKPHFFAVGRSTMAVPNRRFVDEKHWPKS